MNRSAATAAVVRLCSSSPHLLLLIHDLVHDWGRVARQLHTVRCPRLSPAPASRLCHGRELRSPMAGRIGCGMDRARGRAPSRPWFGPATRNGTPQPRARAAEPGEGERRSRPGGARGAGWGWNATQHQKGMAGMGATRGGTPPAARTPHPSTITVTQATCPLCCPLGSFPVIAILALLCCAHALSWHIRHQKPRRKLQASSQS